MENYRTNIKGTVVKSVKLMTTSIAFSFLVVPISHAISANETGSANILAPLNLSSNTELRFGDVSPDLVQTGTVEVQTDGNRVCSSTITCFDTSPTGAASFSVTGYDGAMYDISIPATIVLNGSETAIGHSMTATLVGSKASGTLVSGSDSFTIGGTLTVGVDQEPGTYEASFIVSIQYQ